MSVSLEEVHLFAGLAKLRLDPGEAERLRLDLNRILEHVDGLGDLADGPTPEPGSAHVTPAGAATPDGPDTLAHGPDRMAPAWREGLFLVPPPGGVEPEGP